MFYLKKKNLNYQGSYKSLNKVAEYNLDNSFNTTSNNSIINQTYLNQLNVNNILWFKAGTILVKNINNTEQGLLAIWNDQEAKNLILEPSYTHIGLSYSFKLKSLNIILTKSPYPIILPDCTNFIKKEHNQQILKREKENSTTIYNTTILINNTPINSTYSTLANIKKQEIYPPILFNLTKQSKRLRLKNKLRNNPIVRWKTSRSGRTYNGIFDYNSIDTKHYKFNLKEILCSINFARKQALPSSPPVGANLILMEIARNHTEWMALNNRLVNGNEGGFTIGEKIVDGGLEWKAYGQNIARGVKDVNQLLSLMLRDRGHRERLLGLGFGSIGIWYVPKGHYWTILLAKGDQKDLPPTNCNNFKMDFITDHF
ncbi:hypothetical protein K502DRAFT_206459 [Neoconidiobolus thromboides FSU 785]|nr:hypothetical protein K502DRAFT_206459 [Neoconidiobolus thromboides FSU 785]